MSRTTERYHPTLITLHWLTLLLMVGVYAAYFGDRDRSFRLMVTGRFGSW